MNCDTYPRRSSDGQTQYVSHPIRSLAQAYVYRNQCQPFGIYADARMVGYVMVIYDYDVPEYDIWHMMIDAAEQGKGYGTAAMKAVLDYIATKPFGDSGRAVLTCHQANIPAMRLYESLGFQHTGNVDEDSEEEMVKVVSSEVATIADSSAFVAGGIASSFGSSISDVELRNTVVKAGVASAVVGKAIPDAKLSIKSANLYGVKIQSKNANTVAAGILAVHNAGGAVVINDCYIDSESTITSTAMASGIVGDVTGDESALVAENIKTFAKIELLSSADAVAAAGAVAKLSAVSLNNVQLKNIKALGSIIGNAAVGGMIGVVKGIGSFNGIHPGAQCDIGEILRCRRHGARTVL